MSQPVSGAAVSLVGALQRAPARRLIIIGGVITLIGIISGSPHWQLGLIAGISMTVSLGIGTVAGSALPIVTRRLGADPATASTIFLTMITDSMSFLVFLGLAALLQNWLVS